ncbi:hypothetical protein DRO56_04655 [Candidatus Bathyarchaeota archaeon]|nr:MAG: hypothetical protein DRO56_04655 [Candidatus Bathyarchaeota archaeon]
MRRHLYVIVLLLTAVALGGFLSSHLHPGGRYEWRFSYTIRPLCREVEIDIRPWSPLNIICLGSHGVVPVAVLTTDDFDASDVNTTTVLFAGAPPLWSCLLDVDRDGDLDLLLFFRIRDLQLEPSSTEATLTGYTYDGTCFQGSDSVMIVPCHPEVMETTEGSSPETVSQREGLVTR